MSLSSTASCRDWFNSAICLVFSASTNSNLLVRVSTFCVDIRSSSRNLSILSYKSSTSLFVSEFILLGTIHFSRNNLSASSFSFRKVSNRIMSFSRLMASFFRTPICSDAFCNSRDLNANCSTKLFLSSCSESKFRYCTASSMDGAFVIEL